MKRVGLALMTSLALATQANAAAFNDLTSFLAATVNVNLINFDFDPEERPTVDGTQIGGTYAALGVTFPDGNIFEANFIGPVSPPNGWLNNTFIGGDAVFDANFIVGGVTAVGVHNVFNGSIPNGGLLRAFDAANNLLESVLSDSDGNTLDFFGVTTDTPIARITISALTPNGWGLDNLYFGEAQQQAPEPGTLLLLVFGLLGGSLARRRPRV